MSAAGGVAAFAPGSTPSHSSAPLIRTSKLTKNYGSLVAVDHLDLEVHAGEIFGLLGPNGAGKTTTILMLLGLSEPTSGEARVVGLDPARRPLDVKRRVGYLPDNAGFYGGLTGRANLRYTARLNGLTGRAAEEQIDTVLGYVGLTDAADNRVDTYSRGMRQRLGIADALVKDPLILILDEPTIAIDPIGVAEILDLMRRLVHDKGLALLLASHLLDQVQSVCDRVGIFHAGRMIGQGTVAELAARYGEDAEHVRVGVAGVTGDGVLDPERISRLFGSIAGVAGVRSPDHAHGSWSVELRPGTDRIAVEQSIVRAVIDDGLRLTRLEDAQPSLEQIYRRAVQRAGEPGPRGVPRKHGGRRGGSSGSGGPAAGSSGPAGGTSGPGGSAGSTGGSSDSAGSSTGPTRGDA